MLVLATSLSVLAYDFKVDGIAYNIINASTFEVEVTSGGDYDKANHPNISIPAEVIYNNDSYHVTRIGDDAFNRCPNYLKSVVIPEGVTSIGYHAFYDCYQMETISLPNSLTSIEKYAFQYNFSLNNIVIPSGIKSIEEGTFYGLRNRLTNISLPEGLISIGEKAFGECCQLKTLHIPETVTSIGDNCFYECNNLDSIYLPASIAIIGDYAFNNCDRLRKVIINDYIEVIGNEIFCDCFGLEVENEGGINYAGTILIGVSDKSLSEYTIKEGTKLIYNNAFNGCGNMTSVTIPSSVFYIGSDAFANCNKLEIIDGIRYADTYLLKVIDKTRESYTIKDGTRWLGNESFQGCVMSTVTLPISVEKIGVGAFEDCGNLLSITLSDNLSSIGASSFKNCVSLSSLVIPDGVIHIGNGAFHDCSSLESITIPESITSIGDNTFSGCTALTEINISDSISMIGDNAFLDCSSLRSINIPNSVFSIGEGAFKGCVSLSSSITIPSGVKTISPSLFYDCLSLQSVIIQDGVNKIDNCAFYNCSSLRSIVIPESVSSIEYRAFWNCSALEQLNLPKGITAIHGQTFYNCSSLTEITIPENMQVIDTRIGNSSSGSWEPFERCCFKKIVILSPIVAENFAGHFNSSRNSAQIVVFPEGITKINDGVFDGFNMLQSFQIPSTVTSIGNNSFRNCTSLKSIIIPNGITSIGSESFTGCSSLLSISLPETIKSIGERAFNGCSMLSCEIVLPQIKDIKDGIFMGCSSITSIVLQNGITSIGNSSFNGCTSLNNISIPETVTSIGNGAFKNCTSLHLVIPKQISVLGVDALFNVETEFESETPIKLNSESLLGQIGIAIVPSEAFETYIEAEYWQDFMAKIARSNQQTKVITAIANPVSSGLHLAIGEENLNSVIDLTIKGSVNGMDLLVIRNKMKNLRYLDLSEASIVANDDMFDYFDGGCIKADNELGNNAFKNLNLRKIVLPSNLTAIGAESFYDCNLISEIVIPESVTLIGSNAFGSCDKLESVTILGPARVGGSAFLFCNNLRELNISSNLKQIDDYAFWHCRISNDLIFGDSLISIGTSAFEGNVFCKVVFGNNLNYLGGGAFRSCTNLKNLVIPNSVRTIGSEAFQFCVALDTVIIGHGLEIVPSNSFEGCSKLSYVAFGKGLKEIQYSAFAQCSELQSIMLPTSLKRIGEFAFEGCTGLKEFRIPSSVEKIDNNAFSGINKMTAVYAYTIQPISIEKNTFSCWERATLYVPKTSYYTYYLNKQWSQFMTLREFDEPYDYFYLNDDYILNEQTGRIDGVPDMLLNENSAIIVEGNAVQEISEIELVNNGHDGASIVGGNGDVTGTVENLTAKSMKVNISVDGNRWYFFCFPFNVLRDSIECTSNYVFYSYDGSKRAEKASGWSKLSADVETLQKNQGYIFQTSRNGILTIHVGAEYLKFTANNEKEILHTYASDNTSDASWNLIGNPFISYYDVQDLAKEYDAPIVVWNGKGYDAYKPGDDNYQLKPFEAFFVQKENSKSYVEFLPQNRITYNEAKEVALLRARKREIVGTEIDPSRQIVNITIMNADSVTDRTRIVYNDKAKIDYEIGSDVSKFKSEGIPQVYTINGGIQYAINERPMGADDIKLGYIAPKAGVYTLAVPRHDADVEIYDNVAGAVVDFTFGDYTFESAAGTFNDRFVIRKTGGVTAIENGFRLDGLTVKSTEGGLSVNGLHSGTISVYLPSGAKIDVISTDGEYSLPAGTYLIKYNESDSSIKMTVI